MRVLLVTHYYPEHKGGIEIVAGELAQRLVRRGVDVVWAASGSTPIAWERSATRIPMPAWNFSERFLGFPYPIWGPSSIFRLYREVRRCDLVHLHDSLYMGNVLAYVFARLLGKPVVVTQHVGPVPYSRWVLNALLAVANHTLASMVLGGCDHSIFISRRVQSYFAQFVRFRRAPRFIPNGVANSTFRPLGRDERRCLRDELGLPINKPIMLFVGRFVEKKGLPILRMLAEHFPDCEWIVIGWGPIDPTSWGLPNVRCLGSMDRTRITAHFQAADLLVLPSVGEGFPLVVQEAMACGTPALISEETAQGLEGIETVAYVSDLARENLLALMGEILDSKEGLQALCKGWPTSPASIGTGRFVPTSTDRFLPNWPVRIVRNHLLDPSLLLRHLEDSE